MARVKQHKSNTIMAKSSLAQIQQFGKCFLSVAGRRYRCVALQYVFDCCSLLRQKSRRRIVCCLPNDSMVLLYEFADGCSLKSRHVTLSFFRLVDLWMFSRTLLGFTIRYGKYNSSLTVEGSRRLRLDSSRERRETSHTDNTGI